MRVALAQMDIIRNSSIKNINKIDSFAKMAKDKEVDLLLFPEMCLSGFEMDITKLGNNDIDIKNNISEICIRNSLNIGFGYGIACDEKGENKFIFISAEGKVILEYTKIHPFSMLSEDKFFKSGKSIEYCEINNMNFSAFICYDLRFPYIFQEAGDKAEVIIVAANWPESRSEHWITLLKARAIENQCYILGVNRVGVGNDIVYSGDSMIIDPNGNIVSKTDKYKEDLIVAEIDIKNVFSIREKMNVKQDRINLN